MKITYQERKIEDIFRYFVEGFATRPANWEAFYDPRKGTVIFKLYVEDESPEDETET